MRMTQRFTALLLSLLMLLSLLPAAGVAEGADADILPKESFSEAFGSMPALTAAPTAEPTAEPTPEPTQAPTEEPTAKPTKAPTAKPTQAPEAEPTAGKTAFVAGLAKLPGGSRVYEFKGLSGSYVDTTVSGVVYAAEQSEDERAIRVLFNNGASIWEGWVKASAVSLLNEADTAAYDAEEHEDEHARTYRGHVLLPISTVSSAPTAEPVVTTPESFTSNVVAVLTPETEGDATIPAEPTKKPEATVAPVTEDESFVAALPEMTVAPMPEPSFEPDMSDDLSDLVEYRALSAPTNLSASHNRVGKMTLTWDGTEDADAYQVLYKAAWQTDYSLLATTGTTSYTTSDLDPSTVYYFRVQGVQLSPTGGVLNASPHSASYPYIVLGDAKINDPRGKDTSTIRLTWTAVAGATHYDVMMSVHGADDWSIVRTDLVTDYCDISNISFDLAYDFRVIPKRKLGNGTVITGNSSRVIMVGSPMETPSFQQYDWTENGLKLTWDAIPGASGYVIYRRAFSDPDVNNYQKLVVLDKPVTTYTDTTMEPGEVYYYFVYSFKLCQPEGWRCFSLKGDIGMGVWLPKPTGLQASDYDANNVLLSWPAVKGASHYDVYFTRTPGQTPSATDGARLSVTSGYHQNVPLGTTTYYFVRPVRLFSNGDVSIGPWSDPISHTHAEARPTYRALVIGNTYPNQDDYLPGCDNDAKAVAAMLRTMGGTPYTVSMQLNLSDSGMINAIRSTFSEAQGSDVSLFFFSGHGANSPETNFHGALVGINHTYLAISRLKEALDAIPGKKVVIIDSCHSGQMIGKGAGSEVSQAELSAFNSAVISTFASDANTVVKTVDELAGSAGELFAAEPMMIARGENDLANGGYYVITASHSTEQSVSMGYDNNHDGRIDKYFGLFTYGLCYGSGWHLPTDSALGSLPADRDGNSEITLYEAYIYAKATALSKNPNQTAQIYPANSGLVLWSK